MSKKLFSLIAVVALVTAIAYPFGAVHAAATTPAPTLPASALRIFYFTDTPTARESLFNNPSSIDVLVPQGYFINDKGNLAGSISPDILAFAQTHNIKVMPYITNSNFDQASLTALFSNPTQETTAINQLVAEGQKMGFWGWQLDFEQINVSHRNDFSSFAAQFATSLRAANLESSAAVVAQTTNNPNNYPNNEWVNLAGAYDYASLGQSLDFVTVMAYDDPRSLTAVAPLGWINQVVDYSLQYIPASKLSLGLPTYGWQWNEVTGERMGVESYDDLINDIMQPGSKTGYDANAGAAYATYKAMGENNIMGTFTTWYENGKSFTAYASIIKKNHLQGFSAWVLGLESPDIYASITK